MIWLLSLCLAAEVELRIFQYGTGDPVVATASWAEVHTQTDESGHLVINIDEPQEITFTAEGFLNHTALISVRNKPHRIYLKPGRPPMEIVVEAFSVEPEVSRQAVDAEMMYETPGNREDAVRLVQSLAGVAVQREYSPSAGTLSVRGSAPHDSRYYLDGIELPYLYHFNQYASVFPASQLSTLELYSSTFGARYGDSVGAIVEAESSTERPEAVHGSAFVNFVVGGAQVTVPLPGKWWASVSARRSYQDLANSSTDQYTVWPIFTDHALRLEHSGDLSSTGLFFWGAEDQYVRAVGELDVADPVQAENTDPFDFRRGFWVAGGRHTWNNTNHWGRAVAAVVRDHLDGVLENNGSESSSTLSFNSRLDSSFRQNELGLDVGYEVRAEQMELIVKDPGNGRALVANEASALARGVPVDERLVRTTGGLYSTAHIGSGDVGVMPALRVGFDSLNSQAVTIEPRISARWRVGDSTGLRVAAGRYTQRPPTEHLFSGTGDRALPTTTSWQVAAGIEQTVANRITFNLEGYAKSLSQVLVFPVDSPAEVVEDGAAFGGELTARYRIREVFFLNTWVGVSRSQVRWQQAMVPGPGDQPINLGVVTSYDPNKHVNIGLRYRLGSGLPYTPLNGSVYDAGQDDWIPTPGALNSLRFPLYQKMDLRFAYTMYFKRLQITTSAEVWYTPKKSAQLYPAWNYDYTETTFVRGPTLFPLAGIRAKF